MLQGKGRVRWEREGRGRGARIGHPAMGGHGESSLGKEEEGKGKKVAQSSMNIKEIKK